MVADDMNLTIERLNRMQSTDGSRGMRNFFSLLIILFVFMFYACGDSTNTSSTVDDNMGSAAFSVKWIGANGEENYDVNVSRALSTDCGTLNIANVSCDVIDENNLVVAKGGPWACSLGTGLIDGIPQGHNNRFMVFGTDAQGNNLYRGEKTGITIIGGQKKVVGTIIAYPFKPTLLIPEDNSNVTSDSLQLQWTVVEGINQYRIQVSDAINFVSLLKNELIASTTISFSDIPLGTACYWRVLAVDFKGNESVSSDIRSFTVSNVDMTVSVDSPINASSYDVGDTVTFTGSAQDALGNDITGTSLVWASSVDGDVGTGETIYASLSAGEHTITLTATDNNDNIGSDSVSVTVNRTWYRDSDNDNYGDPDVATTAPIKPDGYVSDNTDCNDASEVAYPGGTEVCNDSLDNDCDGFIDCADEGDCPGTMPVCSGCTDGDGDTYYAQSGCGSEIDCDDSVGTTNPGETDICGDEIDQDCTGSDYTGPTYYYDSDGDTYGDPGVSQAACEQPSNYVSDNTDCDDMIGSIYPGATEILDDGIDQDCDGSDQTADPTTWYRDSDTDGYGNPSDTTQSVTQPSGYVSDNTDCDDTDINEHPNQTWYLDGDSDGHSIGTTNTASCTRPPNYYIASELTATTGDCDDVDSDEYPGQTWYHDYDADTFGDNTDPEIACERPADHVLDNTDCDDTEVTANPNGTEICGDGIDQDCSGSDLACATDYGLVAYYPFNGSADDESGNGNDGTEYGGISYTTGAKGNGTAIGFDGVSDYIDVATVNINIDTANYDYTISGWFKPITNSEGYVVLLTNNIGGTDHCGPLLYWRDGTLYYSSGISNSGIVSATVNGLSLNQWYHFVGITFKDKTVRLYVDTMEGTSGSYPTHVNTDMSLLHIGGNDTNNNYVQCELDEVRIYNRALSATEIKLLYEADYANSLDMTFKLIPSGIFTMGSPDGVVEYPIGSGNTPVAELGRDTDETPHEVTLTKSFYMMSTEVTQGQWEAVMGSNPSYFPACGSDCPVEMVSWDDVQTFIENLNSICEGTYRLPTEAEWEYAARAGSSTAIANGGITATDCTLDANLDAMGWYCNNSTVTYGGCSDASAWGGPACAGTHPVAQKASNIWGLYDMHGNVWEWCQDWSITYPTNSVTDPKGPSSGSKRINRGGGWDIDAMNNRSADRHDNNESDRIHYLGFRLVREYTGTDPYNIGLVAHYPFDGNANDTSGNSNDGTVNGATPTTDRFGNADSAYSFDGDNHIVTEVLGVTSDITFSAWFQHVALNVRSSRIGITLTGSNDGFLMDFNNGLRFFTGDGSGSCTSEAASMMDFTDGSWHFATGVQNSIHNKTSLYVDGQRIVEVDGSCNLVDNSFYIGDDIFRPEENGIIGDLDDIRIYDRALTAPEIQSLYRANGPPFTEFEAISTVSAIDWEHFVINGETYLAVANYRNDSFSLVINSKIYKWNGSSFTEFQSILTNGAHSWEFFTIDGESYLAVANSENNSSKHVDSKIYKWNGSLFVEFQSIPTIGAAECESFAIDGDTYLAIANYRNDSAVYNIDSKIYKWNGSSFIEIQSIPTNAGYDWESFVVDNETYLAIANYYNGSTYSTDSKIFKWNGSSFIEYQAIATSGGLDWESFNIEGEAYLAVANERDALSVNVDSKIYKWNGLSFVEIQSIPTNGATDWESFIISGETYLAVANGSNGSTNNIDSKLYKWNGSIFIAVQSIATNASYDWECFIIDGETYLSVANFYNDSTYHLNSKIYK